MFRLSIFKWGGWGHKNRSDNALYTSQILTLKSTRAQWRSVKPICPFLLQWNPFMASFSKGSRTSKQIALWVIHTEHSQPLCDLNTLPSFLGSCPVRFPSLRISPKTPSNFLLTCKIHIMAYPETFSDTDK